MADVTGGTPPTNASPFAVPADIKEVYDHFGDIGKYSVTTAASLPASGNWDGRHLWVEDVLRFYVWQGASWLPQLAVKHGLASGATNAGGALSVAHGMGSTPSRVLISETSGGTAPATRSVKLNGKDATTFQVIAYNGGAPFGLNAIEFEWVAFA